MSIQLWIRPVDEKRLCDMVKGIALKQDDSETLTGTLDQPGFLSAIGKKFALGRKKIWLPKSYHEVPSKQYPFVYIKNSGGYNEGLILCTFSAIDVHFHLGNRTIDEKTGIHREELFGSDHDPFIGRVFWTYDDTIICKSNDRDKHLCVYSCETQK